VIFYVKKKINADISVFASFAALAEKEDVLHQNEV